MQLKFGPLISDASGSIGGTTFQRSFIAPIARTKPRPTLRRTSFNSGERQLTQFASRSWRTLSPTERRDWQTLADSITWLNRFGDTIRGLGYWLYMRCNQYLHLIGGNFLPLAPAFHPMDVIVDPHGDFGATPIWKLEWTAPATISADQVWAVFASRWCSPGRSRQFGQLRYVGYLFPGTPSAVDFYREYVARFGAPPPSGQVVFVRFLPIDYNTGQMGVPVDYIATT